MAEKDDYSSTQAPETRKEAEEEHAHPGDPRLHPGGAHGAPGDPGMTSLGEGVPEEVPEKFRKGVE